MLSSQVATVHDNSAHGEDSFLVRALGDHLLLDAVMDGVTRRGGGQATRFMVEALAAAPLASADDVVAVLEQMNQRLYQIGRGRFLLTTISAALYQDDKLYVVGIGDSPVFLIRSGAFHQLSSPLPGVFLGARTPLEDLYRAEVTLQPDDRVVLATDGMTDNLTRNELVEIVQRAAAPEHAAEQLSTLMATRYASGQLPGPPRDRFRYDDWTALIRFFSAPGYGAPPEQPASAGRKSP